MEREDEVFLVLESWAFVEVRMGQNMNEAFLDQRVQGGLLEVEQEGL